MMRACPICENKKVDILHSQRFVLPEGHPLSEGYNVVCCQSCGFVYADTTVTQEAYDHFYAQYSKYEDKKTGTGGVDNPFDLKRQQDTARQIADFLHDPKANILDVGCANGGMLLALRELNYHSLCGIDPSPACVENTRLLGIEAHIGSLFQPFQENAFDCVILSHTLEHVQDVRTALTWIENRLKPNGVLYIETPDAARYEDFIYAPFQDFNTEHINHFSLTCLENLMQIHGFSLSSGGAKDLVAGVDLFYPAVFGFWKKTTKSENLPMNKDHALRIRIEEYIRSSRQMMAAIELSIAQMLNEKRPIIVWGTGQLAMKLLAETSLAHAEILAFVDNNPINHGKSLLGKSIISPLDLDKWDAPILITTLLHHKIIAKQIRDMGISNEILFLQGEHS